MEIDTGSDALELDLKASQIRNTLSGSWEWRALKPSG
jgi:hypothetical protein